MFLHDSAPYHTSNDTQHWLETEVPLFFTKTEWPGNSPDANPIENILSHVQALIGEAEPKNAEELVEAFLAAWKEATQPEKLQRLFGSCRNRMERIISARGAMTRY